MSDSQITVRELIEQLKECPTDALVDCSVEPRSYDCPSEVSVQHDENLEVTVTPYGQWATLRGVE